MKKIISLLSEIKEISTQFMQGSISKRVIASIVVFLFFWLLKKAVIKLLSQKINDSQIRYRWIKAVNYLNVFIIIILVGRIWFIGIQSIATFLGLFSAGLAIALKDLLANLAGWLFILWRKPFNVGERIEIDNLAGDVIDIRPFQFTILEVGNWVEADQSTGRMIHIPNGKIFTHSIANYESGFSYIWNELQVLITFESNWKKAKSILNEIITDKQFDISQEVRKQINNATKHYLITYKKLTPKVYTSVEESGVLLTIRYLCKPRQRRGTQELLWEKILDFYNKEKDIDFAYPTIRYYKNNE